jgi:tetratricopeptide (TPR) repeat protein
MGRIVARPDSERNAGRTADISREYQSALAQHQAGRLDRAEAIYRKVLRRAPDHIDALHHIGVIAYERGRHEDAVRLISDALERAPEFADAHLNLGRALRGLGRLDEAATAYRRAISLKPDLAFAHCNLATVLCLQGIPEAALDSASRAADLMPGLAEAHINRGIALASLRRYAEAEAAYRRALALQPNRAQTLSDLGSVLSLLKRFDEAIACHQQAAALEPNNPNTHFRLGETLASAGDPYGSEASWKRGIAIDPNAAKAWSCLGHIKRVLGRFDDARSCFQRAIELDPELPEADAGLAIIGQRADDEGQLRRLRGLLARADNPAGARIDAGFALGMLLDNTDRFDEAFACFAEANALRRNQLAAMGEVYNHAALRQLVNGMIESCTPELFSMVAGDGNPSETPVFIVGMPRSGTSLVEQIAVSHSGVFGAGELDDIASIDLMVQAHGRERSAEELDPDLARRLADAYVVRLQNRGSGSTRVIDKMPDNILRLGLIAVLFPKARIIFCRRDLRDTCLSCYFQKFDDPMPYAQDLADCGLRALEIERLANHWRKVLPLPMLTIDYEKLVADLEDESRRLIEFLGLDWEPACLEFHKTERPILTASGWKVRQPLFTRSVGRKYERHLGPLLDALAGGGAIA